MRQLALTLNGTSIPGTPGLSPQFNDLGSVVSAFLDVGFYIAAFLMVFWVFWGVFQYIFAGGDKNSLTAAKKRISWAIAGFVLLGLLFAISQYVQNIFPQSFHRYPGLPTLHNTIKDITVP